MFSGKEGERELEKRYTLSVHDMSRNKLCEIYDSTVQTEGEAYDVNHKDSMTSPKTVTFTIPRKLNNGEDNYRAAFMTNDYQLRWGVDGVFDWFVIDNAEDAHVGQKDVIRVTANHISTLLNRKNLYGVFDDTNGIDTCANLITKALTGTGWTLGECDTFYEADGTTEKIRSYTCNEKTAAYSMITSICELFVAYPTFNGDAKTVDIHAIANHDGLMEVIFGKNLDSLTRKRVSGELITRLYVEGAYDQKTYVGIDNATGNTYHLPFIMNFDYYRQTGQFTQTHETALTNYLSTMATSTAAIQTAAAAMLASETALATIWGDEDFVLYSVSSGTATYVMKTTGATDDDKAIVLGNVLAAVKSSGEYEYVTMGSTPSFGSGVIWAVKFLGPVSGNMGAKEVAVEAKNATIATLTSDIAAATTDKEKASLTEEKTTQEAAVASLNTSRYADMLSGISYARSIGTNIATIETQQGVQATAEATLENALGDMLKDGTWNDKNYVAGQEDSLYQDALMIAEDMSKPQYEYTISILDLSSLTGHEGEDFKINQTVRLYDAVTNINDYAFVEEITTVPRRENANTIKLSTDERGVA